MSDTNHFDLNRPMTRTASDDEYDSFENRTSENLTLADHLPLATQSDAADRTRYANRSSLLILLMR